VSFFSSDSWYTGFFDKNKNYYNQQRHKNVNSHTRKLSYAQNKPNETTLFRGQKTDRVYSTALRPASGS